MKKKLLILAFHQLLQVCYFIMTNWLVKTTTNE